MAVAANQTFTVNDVALARIDGELMPCRILAHCQADDDMPFTFVNRWCVEDRSDKYCMIARRAEDVKPIATKDLLSSVIYRLMSDPSFVAILVAIFANVIHCKFLGIAQVTLARSNVVSKGGAHRRGRVFCHG